MSRAAATLVAVGALAMLGQVALLRELAVASFGVELVLVAGTALWLAAGAAGALAGRGAGRGSAAVAAGLCALALLVPAEIAFLRGARSLLGGVPGAYLPLGQQLLTAAVGLAPAGALLGWLFRRAAADLGGAGGSLGAAYGWESLGGAIGSAVATLSLAAGRSNLALALGGACAAAAAAALRPSARRYALPLAGALAAALPLAPLLDRLTTAWSHPALAGVADTPQGRVVVVEAEGQVAVFENDALAYDGEGTGAELLVHPAALEVAEGARVLVVEGAWAGIVREVLKHHPSRVLALEQSPSVLRAVLPHLPDPERAALSAPRVELRFEDARAYLRGDGERFDVVLVGAPEPSSGATNRFYTVEFFRRCAARLAPGGVLALRLPAAENFRTPLQLLRTGAVHAALRAAFADVLLLPGSTDLLLASAAPLERDPAVLGARLRARGVAAREITPELVAWLLTNDRVEASARALADADARPNRDARPVCYQQTALLWLGRLAGEPSPSSLPGERAGLAAVVALAASILAARALARGRGLVLVGAAALAGMLLEAAVVLRYQAQAGALYRDLGVLLTSFMLGLALGAAAWDRARARLGPPRRWWGAVPVAGLAALGLAVALGGASAPPAPLALAAGLLCGTGAAVGAVFAAASGAAGGPPAAGPLYAADLLGGALGSLLAVGLLLLALGVDGTAFAAAALAAAALALAPGAAGDPR